MKSYLPLLILLAVILSVTSGSAESFRFAPGDSLSYRAFSELVRVRTIDGSPGPVDTTSTKTYYHISRTSTGWTKTGQPVSIATRRNGQPVKNPIFNVLMDTEIIHTLDSNGLSVKVDGFDEVINKVEARAAPLLAQAKAELNPTRMARQDMAEWNSRMRPLVGRQLQLGPVTFETVSHELPTGQEVDLYVAVALIDTMRIDDALCARVDFHSDTNLRRLAGTLGMNMDSLAVLVGVAPQEWPAAEANSIQGSRQLVVEVGTLRSRSEHAYTETFLTARGPDGKPHEIAMQETKDTDYSYDTAVGK